MKHLKRNIRGASMVLLSLFMLLTAYFYYNLFLYSDRWFSNPNNARVRVDMDNPHIIPGSIMDRNQTVLVETKSFAEKNGSITYYRHYNKDSKYAAHVIGSRQYGIGAEVLYIKYLLGYDNNLFERIYQKAFLDQEQGNNVILTIDMQLQKYIVDAMGNEKGSVVLMHPQTGEILAMASQPAFDPSIIHEEPAEGSLLNKAAQGLYPPGSIMKVITAAAALENIEGISAYSINCKGVTEVDGVVISCYGGEAHGNVDFTRAMEVSCNAYFAEIVQKIGWKQFKKTAEAFGFNKDYIFPDIKTTKSHLPVSRNTEKEELLWSAVGQGKVLASPLHMALVASSIANGGTMLEPKLIYGIQSRTGKIHLQQSRKIAEPISSEAAEILTNTLIGVVENGTGRQARSVGMLIAGKTGTAEVGADKKPHAWFIGFAPADNPTLAIAVILENSGTGGSKAAPLAARILREASKLGY
jgi:peptidoglycan glycosyltransferase